MLALAVAGPAQAAITVANTNDSGPGSLRQAIAGAPAGRNDRAARRHLHAEPANRCRSAKSVTIAGHAAADTTIRAGRRLHAWSKVSGRRRRRRSAACTIRDGRDPEEGGGISSLASALSLRGVTVTANTVNGDGAPGETGKAAEGGGLWVAEGSLSLAECSISGNTATARGGKGAHGGFVEGAGAWASSAPVTVTTTTFAGNHAIAHGGEEAISTEQFGGVAEGGGLWVEEAALNVSSSKFENNEAQAIGGPGAHGGITEGGGLWVDGAMTVTATSFTGNALDSRGGQGLSSPDQKGGVAEGGGLWAAHEVPGAAIVGGSSFKYNRIDASGGFGGAGGIAEGGAVWDVPEENVTFSLSRSTVALNSIRNGGIGSSGTSEGGGIWVVTEDEASAALVGTTLAENEIDAPGEAPGVSAGGNLYSTGTVSVADSIVSGGFGPAGSENCFVNETTSLGFNIESLDQCGFKAAGDEVDTRPPARLAAGQRRPDPDDGAGARQPGDRPGQIVWADEPTSADLAADRPAVDSQLGGGRSRRLGCRRGRVPTLQCLLSGQIDQEQEEGDGDSRRQPARALGGHPDPERQRPEDADEDDRRRDPSQTQSRPCLEKTEESAAQKG